MTSNRKVNVASKAHPKSYRVAAAALFLLAVALMPVVAPIHATRAAAAQQDGALTFAKTGKSVRGPFLDYWEKHGGLAQQGYPISNEFMEQSDLDGKIYRVQYFERAVFEYHPENKAPYDVLLSLLGVFRYNDKYPNGAPAEQADKAADTVTFPQTGKHLGGAFLAYWRAHDGLAQQGYPISEEFTEVSDLDGQAYTVQYFQRAVFEWHPEKPDPYKVLLSQLGRFELEARYAAGQPDIADLPPWPTPTPTDTPTAAPTSRPTSTSTSTSIPISTPTGTPIATRTVTSTPVPVPPSGSVFAIGDSVMLGASAEMRRSIKSIDIDAAVSRQVSAGISILRARSAAGRLADSVVIDLGNNGTFTSQQFDTIMQVLDGAGVRRVVFLNVKVPRVWESGDNAVIAAGVSRYSNAVLVNWKGASSGHPEYFAPDGFHLTPQGAKAYSQLIAGSVAGSR